MWTFFPVSCPSNGVTTIKKQALNQTPIVAMSLEAADVRAKMQTVTVDTKFRKKAACGVGWGGGRLSGF